MNLIKQIILTIFLIFSASITHAQTNNLRPELYGTANWNADSLGNHRVVIRVSNKTDLALAHIEWRRRDTKPEAKGIIIINAQTGTRITDILPVTINREFGDILFRPTENSSDYYVYYLKYKSSGRSNYPQNTYPPFVQLSSPQWLAKAEAAKNKPATIIKAQVIQFQSVNGFNSFYPMEIIATQTETEALIKNYATSGYLLFPEARENSIRMTNDLPAKWIADGQKSEFSGKASKGEYFTFQLGLYPVKTSAEDVKVTFGPLTKSGKQVVPNEAFTCFNTSGVDWEGKPFQKKLTVEKGKVQALWLGLMVPETLALGEYESLVQVKPANMEKKTIRLKLTIGNETIVAHGDNKPEQLTRLRWLNSTFAHDDETVTPYPALVVEKNIVKCLGRDVELNNMGFPQSIRSHFSGSVTKIIPESRELLQSPAKLAIEKEGKELSWSNPSFTFIKKATGAVEWKLGAIAEGFKLDGTARMEFDGNIDYQVVITATQDISVDDIHLEIPFKADVAKYQMGMGQPGGLRPQTTDWKWEVKHNQDGPWIGDVNIGLQARFRDTNYSRPLNTNFYLEKPLNMPPSWYNNGKGGITIKESGNQSVLLSSYSGSRTIKKGEQLHFYFNLLVTPFHTIDTKAHWNERFYHSYKPIPTIKRYGANVVNIHHATTINPFINYPFLRPQLMKAYIDSAHNEGMKVKIYYTVRELTNSAPELFMLRSLNDEIFSQGKGGGFSWLQEHLDDNYIAAWFVPELKDAAVVNTGISRWHNFYVEGLNWLVNNMGIDGLYIDDVAFDRTTMERVRKTLKRVNPGTLIDLHSANQFNVRDGFANSANLYLEHFPFIDRLWFGEYFNYNNSPDFWLVESSGIPYGLMGEMLQDGGNPWRGMVYGMTARAPWSGNPAPLWKFWDSFGIQNAEMIGYWDSACPVSTNSEKAKATVYQKNGKALIAIANWETADLQISLQIDWKKLGINPEKATISARAIENFQPELKFKVGEPITLPGGKGYLLVIE
jgi:hypothetical protein